MNILNTSGSAAELADNQSSNVLEMMKQEWRGSVFTMERNSIAPDEVNGIRENIAEALEQTMRTVEEPRQQDLLIGGMTTLRSFLLTKDTLTSIDPKGLTDLVRLSFESCIDPSALEDLEIRIGYGASDTPEPNARTLAYVIPAIRILKSLRQNRDIIARLTAAAEEGATVSRKHIGKIRKNLSAGRSLSENQMELLQQVNPTEEELLFPRQLPNVIAYSAHNFISSTNTVDTTQVERIVTETQGQLQNFLCRHCPDLAPQFSFDSDTAINPGSFEGIYTEYMGTVLGNAGTPEEQKARDQIIQFGVKKSAGNIDGSLQYGAAHALYSGDVFNGPPIQILQNSAARPEKLLMIGGPPEQYFWRARDIIRRNVTLADAQEFFAQRKADWQEQLIPQADYVRTQLITGIGELPVYGKGFVGEWSIGDLKNGLPFEEFLSGPARSSMRADILQLVAEVAGIPPDKVQKASKNKEKDTTTLQQFKDGYEQLQEILSD